MDMNVDFDVFKALTALRRSEDHTLNDVLRELLHLPSKAHSTVTEQRNGWLSKGVFFPEGTEFRATYKGTLHIGKIENGRLIVDGQIRKSLSDAVVSITHTSVNGWRFWECKLPTDANWRLADTLRKVR
jgi:hypothetical protein